MARIGMTGLEIDPAQTAGGPEFDAITTGGATTTRDTSVFHGGVASRKIVTTSPTGQNYGTLSFTTAASTSWFGRCYLCFGSLPASTVAVLRFGNGSDFSARVTSAGKVQLFNDALGTQIGSDAAVTISADSTTWYRFEMSIVEGGLSTFTNVELRLDGATVASSSGLGLTPNGSFTAGWIDTPGDAKTLYLDDMALNDSTGGSNNSWCGDGKIVLMKPVSDSQRGSWTGGAGGTTNLWDAVNNTPPVGTATETDSTQIESADSSGDNATDEYRGDCGSYTTAGIGASDTINAIRTLCNHGEDVSTGTKTGSFGCQANPAETYGTFTFGADAGALATYPTTWTWTKNTIIQAPSVTLGTSLIIAARKTDTGTRVASIDFLGAYVDYTPAVAAAALILEQGFVDFADPGVLMKARDLAADAWEKRGRIFVPRLWAPEGAII